MSSTNDCSNHQIMSVGYKDIMSCLNEENKENQVSYFDSKQILTHVRPVNCRCAARFADPGYATRRVEKRSKLGS